MSEPEIAISANDVSRMFKRFRHPRHRLMEAFGLPLPTNAYDEFWALRKVSFELRRGDSLAIIGENGAGKSTLLSIICGRLQATSGSVKVRGNIQALMDFGTGFHPEFTGRQNIFSALAYQGVTGSEANRRFAEIIEFSELEDFVDQPIKTYSSGMYARLAFSTATAITPDVLIIDEVLGAGDAYFASKCAERMRHLTKEVGATVLFVSHDMSSVQRLCERAIWLQRGCVKMAGRTVDLAKAYHNSVLERDEARLRGQTSRAVLRLRQREGAARNDRETEILNFQLVAADGQQPPGSQAVARTDETGSISARSIAASVHRQARKVSAERTGSLSETGATSSTLAQPANASPVDAGARPDLPSGPNDKWETAEARFLEIWPCAADTLARKHIFARGEDIAFQIVAELHVDLPTFWIIAVLFDQKGNRIALIAEQVTGPISAGIHEFEMVVHQPTIRQGEYVLTFELLPEFDYNWTGPGRLPYLCLWALHTHFKIDEDHQGAVELGCVYLPVRITHRTVGGRARTASSEPRDRTATERADVSRPLGD